MSFQTPAANVPDERLAIASAEYDYEHRGSWFTFAGVILMIAGVVNVIGGIAAIDNANFFVGNAEFMISDLNTWGWVITILGVGQVLTAIGIWSGNALARWLAVAFAATNAFAQLMMLPAHPLWSLAIFTVDVMIIYALMAYGDRAEA